MVLTTEVISHRIVRRIIQKILSAKAREEIRDAKKKIKMDLMVLHKLNRIMNNLVYKAMYTKLPDDDDFDEEDRDSSSDIETTNESGHSSSDGDASVSTTDTPAFPQKLINDADIPDDKKPRYTITIADIRRYSMKFEDFSHSSSFTHVADVLIDRTERQTLVEFSPVDVHKWRDHGNWIYMFTVDDFIVKIGGTKNGLKQRAGSYLCGHYTRASGKCSVTNGLIYNTLLSYLKDGAVIRMYGMKCLPVVATVDVFGECHTVEAQIFDVYESVLIRKHAVEHGAPPIFSSRSDPRYS